MKHQPKQPTTQNSRSGIHLIEVIVSTLLIGLVTVTSLKTVGGVFRTWNITVDQYDGTELAQQLMSEILQQSYKEPGASDPTFGIDLTLPRL